MTDFLGLSPSTWFVVFLGLCLATPLVLIAFSSIVKSGAVSPAKPPPESETQAAPPPPGDSGAALFPPRGSEGPAPSFKRALHFLRTMVGGRDYQYRLPWFLILGEPGSGKSSLIAEAGAELSGAAEQRLSSGHQALEWSFLDEGVLIEPSGYYLRGGKLRGTFDWAKLLRLFQNNRPRRPLDGLVVTIPASDLVGPSALDESVLTERAGRLAEMLSMAQKSLGFAFPVYTIITKCDEIAGFSGFCRELPAAANDEVFGWSSPYHLDSSFTVEWVDQAFDQIAQDLQRLQSEVFVERPGLADPDAVFLFPEEFGRLRSPLRAYIERLFRQSAYRESFRFCGLYFTGEIERAALSAPAPMLLPMDDTPLEILAAIPPPSLEILGPPPQRRPAYVRQIFERKIFPQAGLARPLSNVYLTRSRTVLAIQCIAAVLAVVLVAGTWMAYRRLRVDVSLVDSALREMPRKQQSKEEIRPNLLRQLALAGNAYLRSPFFPSSWFSSLDDNLTRVMEIACERWVLKIVREGLVQKANTLLSPPPDEENVATEPADEQEKTLVLDLDRLPEYLKLERFVSELTKLQDMRALYESVRNPGNIANADQLGKIVDYLYGTKLGEFEPNGHFARALARSSGQPLEISSDVQVRASEQMTQLADDVFSHWFGESVLLVDMDLVKSNLALLDRGTIVNRDQLKELLAALQQLDNDVRLPSLRWVSNPRLDLSGPFRRVFYEPLVVRKNPYILPATFEAIRRSGEEYLGKLRDTLASQRTSMSGPLLDLKDKAVLSKGTKDLEIELENAMNLPFMAPTGNRTVAITLDSKSRLMWRPDPLIEGLRLMDTYQRFATESLREASPGVQPVLSRITQEQMRRHVQNLIAESQDIRRRPESSGALPTQDELKAEVDNFREVTDAKGPLLEMTNRFQKLGITDVRNSVMRILVLQAYNLLTLLEAQMNETDPYAAKGGKFLWWTGKGALAFESYHVRNAAELADYLNTQRDRIKFLVQESEPLVQFLNTWLPSRPEAQSRLIVKWQRLIANFKQYDGKKPGASLASLEDFILTRMDKITTENGCKDAEPEAGGSYLSQDYFATIHASLRTEIIDRCKEISAQGVYQAYTEIADHFNRTLAGRFPFGPVTDKPASEATQEAVAEFFTLFDRNSKIARGTLNADARFGEAAVQALRFLDELGSLRPFVVPASPDAPKEPPFSLDFIPRFRVNQAGETGGNQIIEWTLQVAGQIFRQQEPEHPGRWRPGNTVRLSLRWANDSKYLPGIDGQSDLKLRDRNAYFELTSRWSLLSFLRRHQASPAEIRQFADPQSYLLKFSTKMVPDPKWVLQADDQPPGTTVVFMSMRLSAPGSKTPIALPPFPASAPRLQAPLAEKGLR
jgi:type VI secretion system protein ImpL